MSGLSRASIANIENGKQRILLHQLLQFAAAFEVEPCVLVPTKTDLPRLIEKERPREQRAYLERLRKLNVGG